MDQDQPGAWPPAQLWVEGNLGTLMDRAGSGGAVILEPKKMKSLTVSIVSPSICYEVMGPDAMILVF